jgi:hypothetical protein
MSKITKISLKLSLVYIIFTAIILLGNRYHFRIMSAEYDLLDLNGIFGGALSFFSFIFWSLPLMFLDALNISWRVPGCVWFCLPSFLASVYILALDVIIIYLLAFLLSKVSPAIVRKIKQKHIAKIFIVSLAILVLIAIAISLLGMYQIKKGNYTTEKLCLDGNEYVVCSKISKVNPQNYGALCDQIASRCNGIVAINCHAEVDGPFYYVNEESGEIISRCGGDILGGSSDKCPPKEWTCSL